MHSSGKIVDSDSDAVLTNGNLHGSTMAMLPIANPKPEKIAKRTNKEELKLAKLSIESLNVQVQHNCSIAMQYYCIAAL